MLKRSVVFSAFQRLCASLRLCMKPFVLTAHIPNYPFNMVKKNRGHMARGKPRVHLEYSMSTGCTRAAQFHAKPPGVRKGAKNLPCFANPCLRAGLRLCVKFSLLTQTKSPAANYRGPRLSKG